MVSPDGSMILFNDRNLTPLNSVTLFDRRNKTMHPLTTPSTKTCPLGLLMDIIWPNVSGRSGNPDLFIYELGGQEYPLMYDPAPDLFPRWRPKIE